MLNFPVFERLIVRDYRLFPGTNRKPEFIFDFKAGVSLIAGINGLGKTTLVNILYRLLVGPWDLPKDLGGGRFGGAAAEDVTSWRLRTRYFSQRVADGARDATAALTFSIGSTAFVIERHLANCRASSVSVNGQALNVDANEAELKSALIDATGVGSYVDFLTAMKYLVFFDEERRDILWDTQAQRQFFRILFVPPTQAQRWSELEGEINRADSKARNQSAIAFGMERDLRAKEEQLRQNAGVGDELAAAQTILDADLQRKTQFENDVLELDEQLKNARRILERTKISEDDALRSLEELRYGAIARLFPSLDDTAKYILTQLFAAGKCLACEADAPDERRRFERALETGYCTVCGAPPQEQRRGSAEAHPTQLERRRFARAKSALDDARTQRIENEENEKRLARSWSDAVSRLSDLSRTIEDQLQTVAGLRAKLPPEPEELEEARKTIRHVRNEEQAAKRDRRTAELAYEKLLKKAAGGIQDAAGHVAKRFQSYVSEFIEERCRLTFRMIKDRPSQGGEFFTYPSLKFEMTAAAFTGQQIRESPDDVSESQREFIDLAFRMALSVVAGIAGLTTLVMETPEASLDVVFMENAARLLRKFAQNKRRVIVTSNLTNSAMIPALMGGRARSQAEIAERWTRVLNLLDLAAPNAALHRHKSAYSRFLSKSIRGR
jgi:AAA domain